MLSDQQLAAMMLHMDGPHPRSSTRPRRSFPSLSTTSHLVKEILSRDYFKPEILLFQMIFEIEFLRKWHN
jgi:hypothetical protein